MIFLFKKCKIEGILMQNRGHLNFTDSHKMATKIEIQSTDLHLDVFNMFRFM